jgi:hypothetical protein
MAESECYLGRLGRLEVSQMSDNKTRPVRSLGDERWSRPNHIVDVLTYAIR